MKKMTKFVSIVLAMMLVLSMGSVAAAEGALKIGFIGPLTGAAAVYGTSAMQGGQIAVDEMNSVVSSESIWEWNSIQWALKTKGKTVYFMIFWKVRS